MSELLFTELAKKCNQKKIDHIKPIKLLKEIMDDEPQEYYIFGEGMAPDNPNTLLELLIIGQKSCYNLYIDPDRIVITTLKISSLSTVSMEMFRNKIKLHLYEMGGAFSGIYINVTIKEYDNVIEFVKRLRKKIDNDVL